MLTSCLCVNPLPARASPHSCERCSGSLEARMRGVRTLTRKPEEKFPLGWIANAHPCTLVEHENPLVQSHFETVAVYKNTWENPHHKGEDVSGGVFAEVVWTRKEGYAVTMEATSLSSSRGRTCERETHGTYAEARSALLKWLPKAHNFVFGT